MLKFAGYGALRAGRIPDAETVACTSRSRGNKASEMRPLFGRVQQHLSYKGRDVYCARGVHEAAGDLVCRYVPEAQRKSARLLDLGAGAGALAQRMLDLGFTDVTAWDLYARELAGLDGVTVDSVDLNEDFGNYADSAGTFSVVLAVEIIEHLENPYHFARQLARVLSRDGVAVVSTPNIESALARVTFLRVGEQRYFDEGSYRNSGHISSLTEWQLKLALDLAGLTIVERIHNLRDTLIPIQFDSAGGIFGYRGVMLSAVLYPFMKGNRDGDINVFAIKHATQPSGLPKVPAHHPRQTPAS